MSITDGEGRVLALPRERDPFMVCVLAVCVLYASIALVFYDQLAATSIRMYPYFGGRVFLVLLGLGSLTASIGVHLRSVTGMRAERAGLNLLAVVCATYALWTPFAIGSRGLPLILFMGVMIAVPSYVAARRLGRQIRQAEVALSGGERPEGVDDGC
jgi:hypothetical protein